MRKRYSAIAVLIAALCAVVVVLLTREKENSDELVLYGNVDVRLVDIGFRVPGRVDKVFFEEGDVVRAGELLCVLDKTPYDSQVNQAKANVEAIRVSLNNAEILFKRRTELIDIGGVSQEDLDNARSARDQFIANLRQSEAQLQIALDDMAYTEVFAPTDGIILTRVLEPGSVVSPGNPVYSLSVTTPVWIRAFVEEPNLGKIYYGMPADIYTDTKGGPIYTGQVGFISPMAEFTPKTVESTQLRTDLVYRLRIYANNPDKYLKQGMPVTVKLKLNRQ